MNTISDNELILHFYRDGLDPARMREIDDALFASPELRARYTRLQQMLHAVDAEPAPEPDAQFAERLWQRLDPRLAALAPARAGAGWSSRLSGVFHSLLAPRAAFAAACMLLLAVGAGFYAGRWSAPQPDEIAQTRANAMAAHVLDAYVAEHLRATEGLLLTAVNSDDAGLVGNRDLAASLVDSNRLYAQAATRSGNTRLADFLRQLEPVLLELANQSPDASVESIDGLRDYLKKTDLLFQVRATQARIGAAGKHST
jgi:anti-sigma factor RsiW